MVPVDAAWEALSAEELKSVWDEVEQNFWPDLRRKRDAEQAETEQKYQTSATEVRTKRDELEGQRSQLSESQVRLVRELAKVEAELARVTADCEETTDRLAQIEQDYSKSQQTMMETQQEIWKTMRRWFKIKRGEGPDTEDPPELEKKAFGHDEESSKPKVLPEYEAPPESEKEAPGDNPQSPNKEAPPESEDPPEPEKEATGQEPPEPQPNHGAVDLSHQGTTVEASDKCTTTRGASSFQTLISAYRGRPSSKQISVERSPQPDESHSAVKAAVPNQDTIRSIAGKKRKYLQSPPEASSEALPMVGNHSSFPPRKRRRFPSANSPADCNFDAKSTHQQESKSVARSD